MNKHQADYYFTGNTKAKFHSQIRKARQTYFRAKGTRIGGTYSGHPTCTTFGNTFRNLMYHLFAIYDNIDDSPFFAEFQLLPTKPYWDRRVRHDMPQWKDFRALLYRYTRMWFAGDDTGILCKTREVREFIIRSDSRIAHTRQQRIVHGLGLVLKNPKSNYKRINILSRHLALSDTGPVVVKMIPKLLLLNASCSAKVAPSEAHFLAAMSYYTYGLDPLSRKLMDLRLAMIPLFHGID